MGLFSFKYYYWLIIWYKYVLTFVKYVFSLLCFFI